MTKSMSLALIAFVALPAAAADVEKTPGTELEPRFTALPPIVTLSLGQTAVEAGKQVENVTLPPAALPQAEAAALPVSAASVQPPAPGTRETVAQNVAAMTAIVDKTMSAPAQAQSDAGETATQGRAVMAAIGAEGKQIATGAEVVVAPAPSRLERWRNQLLPWRRKPAPAAPALSAAAAADALVSRGAYARDRWAAAERVWRGLGPETRSAALRDATLARAGVPRESIIGAALIAHEGRSGDDGGWKDRMHPWLETEYVDQYVVWTRSAQRGLEGHVVRVGERRDHDRYGPAGQPDAAPDGQLIIESDLSDSVVLAELKPDVAMADAVFAAIRDRNHRSFIEDERRRQTAAAERARLAAREAAARRADYLRRIPSVAAAHVDAALEALGFAGGEKKLVAVVYHESGDWDTYLYSWDAVWLVRDGDHVRRVRQWAGRKIARSLYNEMPDFYEDERVEQEAQPAAPAAFDAAPAAPVLVEGSGFNSSFDSPKPADAKPRKP